MKKILATALATILALSMFTGCGQGNVKKETTNAGAQNKAENESNKISGEITYMTATPIYAKMNSEINKELQKVYPNLKVNIEHISDNYESVLKTKMGSGDTPDVFTWQGYLAMNSFIEGKKVADLSKEGFDKLIYPKLIESGKSDSKLYGIPTIVQNIGLLYNKDVFKKAGITAVPSTVSQLEDAISKVKAIGVQPFCSGLKEQWVCYDLFWFAQTPVVKDMMGWHNSMNEGKGTFKNDKMESMFKTFDIIYKNSGDKPLSDDFAEMCNKLAAGEVAMAVQGDWAYDETQKIDPKANLGMTGFPIDEDPKNATILADASEILFVSEESKNKDLAVAFVKWMLSKEGAEYLGTLTHAPSTSTQNPSIELNPFAADANKWIADGNKTASFAWNYWAPGIMDIVGKDMQEYFMKSMTLDKVVADLDSNWTKK